MLWSPFLTTHSSCRTQSINAYPLSLPPALRRILRSCKFKLEKDLRDKLGAQGIDATCAGLTHDRTDLTYSPEAVKIQAK